VRRRSPDGRSRRRDLPGLPRGSIKGHCHSSRQQGPALAPRQQGRCNQRGAREVVVEKGLREQAPPRRFHRQARLVGRQVRRNGRRNDPPREPAALALHAPPRSGGGGETGAVAGARRETPRGAARCTRALARGGPAAARGAAGEAEGAATAAAGSDKPGRTRARLANAALAAYEIAADAIISPVVCARRGDSRRARGLAVARLCSSSSSSSHSHSSRWW
jgi:hypothetical protein